MKKEHFLKRLEEEKLQNTSGYNYDVVPDEFLVTDKIAIECKTHGVFHQKAMSHLLGIGCKKCWSERRGNSVARTTEDFIASSKSKFGDRFSYEKTQYIRKDKPVILTCKKHGDIKVTPAQHKSYLYGCPHCNKEIPNLQKQEKFITEAQKVHGGRYSYEKMIFTSYTEKIEIICREHGSFFQTPYDHVRRKAKCYHCARSDDAVSFEEFVRRAVLIHGDKYEYSKESYINYSSATVITCKKHGKFLQRAGSHLQSCGCKKCKIEETRKSKEEFIAEAVKVHGDIYDYSKVVYSGNKTPVEIICRTHGSFFQKPNSHISARNGCRLCSESKGEKAVCLTLDKLGLEYKREFKVGNKLYRFDFYIPSLEVLVEFHGIQHYRAVEIFGGKKEFTATRKRDREKIALAEKEGLDLIVLNYKSLSRNTLELDLIMALRKCLKKRFSNVLIVDGKVMKFKCVLDVFRAFDIPLKTEIRNLQNEISKIHDSVKVIL